MCPPYSSHSSPQERGRLARPPPVAPTACRTHPLSHQPLSRQPIAPQHPLSQKTGEHHFPRNLVRKMDDFLGCFRWRCGRDARVPISGTTVPQTISPPHRRPSRAPPPSPPIAPPEHPTASFARTRQGQKSPPNEETRELRAPDHDTIRQRHRTPSSPKIHNIPPRPTSPLGQRPPST